MQVHTVLACLPLGHVKRLLVFRVAHALYEVCQRASSRLHLSLLVGSVVTYGNAFAPTPRTLLQFLPTCSQALIMCRKVFSISRLNQNWIVDALLLIIIKT